MSLGIFESGAEVGAPRLPGSAFFDPAAETYTVAGGGENMWGARDAFHFVYAPASGDVALSSDVAFVGDGVDPHRKACLLFRQSLEPDAVYADVAVHGDGLTSLQFRATEGGTTHEIQSAVSAPQRVRLERRGRWVRLFVDGAFSGAAVAIDFAEPFLVGLGVCAHNDNVRETARFTRVERTAPLPGAGAPVLYSALETQAVASTDRRVRLVTPTLIEAPNWLPDNAALLYNGGGQIYRLPLSGGPPARIDTGFATRCNNDHGVTPDGRTLIISDQSQEGGSSLIYTLPIEGGTPWRVTAQGPSYWHGVSPDGATLAYCAQRDGEYDIYTLSIEGGEERRLTTAPGLDDGPEFSPDGAWIYFNSERTGRMQIWRMRADGAEQEQVTRDERNNWFPHLSPDGRWMAFLSYEGHVKGHPPNQDVQLRRMALETRETTVLARLFGGQGTINVPSWSPDSRQIAFVSYQILP